MALDARLWRDLPVLVTGHTGFKGSWLSLWLAHLGAKVHGYALAPDDGPQLFELAGIHKTLAGHHEANVCDGAHLNSIMRVTRPAIVLHLAAQSLVRRAYLDPVLTWDSNVMGTVQVLEAARLCESVRAVVVVSSDKCYENLEEGQPFAESDRLGGQDPYSASKAAAELVVHSYRHSFGGSTGGSLPLLASARAGNVIGGGDFSPDRLVADAARAYQAGQPLHIRNPAATRPWQHVLDALHGYLLLAQGLLIQSQQRTVSTSMDQAFNFGPLPGDHLCVADLLKRLQAHWPELRWTHGSAGPHEAGRLHLDAGKARAMLGWTPKWSLDEGLAHTAHWYSAWAAGADMVALTRQQLLNFTVS